MIHKRQMKPASDHKAYFESLSDYLLSVCNLTFGLGKQVNHIHSARARVLCASQAVGDLAVC